MKPNAFRYVTVLLFLVAAVIPIQITAQDGQQANTREIHRPVVDLANVGSDTTDSPQSPTLDLLREPLHINFTAASAQSCRPLGTACTYWRQCCSAHCGERKTCCGFKAAQCTANNQCCGGYCNLRTHSCGS